MDQQTFDRMPAAWRMAQGHQQQPPPPPRRPQARTLTPEELQTLEGLPWSEYLTQGRALQQTPAPAPEEG